jgi:glycerophosphoryl diester phosphodiesterase
MIAVLIVIVCAALLLLFLVAPYPAGKKDKAAFYGRSFAHRGLHTEDKSVPESSLAAFARAAERGYGVELDVQLSKDGEVVVFHDDDLKRVCGVDKRVDELDLSELKKLFLCGTEQRIPLFSEVLPVIKDVPVIVELKNGRRNRELCEKTLALLNAHGGEYCIESFNPFIVAYFRFHAPHIFRGQLSQRTEDFKKGGMNGAESFILGNLLFNFAARPQFIAYRIGKRPFAAKLARALGALLFGWTPKDPSAEKDNDAVIFEHYSPEIRFK